MISSTDQMGRTVRLPALPQRIISVVPSQTELLYSLGLGKRVVGITKFCIHPDDWFRTKKRVGGTKTLHLNTIAHLNPDLIIGNLEENDKSQIELLMQSYPVWMSDIKTLEDALDMIERIGHLTGTAPEASLLHQQIARNFGELHGQLAGYPVLGAAYLIWRKPYMAAGNTTFIHAMLGHCRLRNVFADTPRYPEIEPHQLAQAAPEIILLSSEPYPFRDKHRQELQAICPGSKVELVDGELFSWYGSRLLHSSTYFLNLRRGLQ